MRIARESAKEALDTTRSLSRELRGLEVKEPLSLALSDAVRTTVPPGIESDVRVSGDESLVPPQVREQLFLILREGVRNAVAHSGASRLRVEVDVSPEEVVGSVVDDGRGFDGARPERASSGDGGTRANGLHSMKERAELAGGRLEVRSAPGEGAVITAYIPLDGNDSANGGSSTDGAVEGDGHRSGGGAWEWIT